MKQKTGVSIDWDYQSITNDLKIIVRHPSQSDTPQVQLSYKKAADLSTVVEPSLKAIFEMFIAERQHYKSSSLQTYKETFRKYIYDKFGELPINEIDRHGLSVYRSELACTYAPRTVNKIFGLLKNLIAFALDRGLTAANPLQSMKALGEPITEVDPFTLEELRISFAHIRGHYRGFFVCLAFTGARPSELMALRWRDVDLNKRLLHIRLARVRGKEGEPKTKRSKRTIPIFPPVEAALKQQAKLSLLDENNYVFVTRDGNPLTKHMDTMWKRALARAGVRHRPMYQLRHTFASMMLAAGEAPAYVAQLMGHTTTETLFRHYARWIPNAVRNDGSLFVKAISSE